MIFYLPKTDRVVRLNWLKVIGQIKVK
jgi:hypothetical protein